jgi:hypothetical protein
MAKKKKLEELSQSHGMEQKFIPSTLEQIWGDEGLTKYGTMDEDVYSNKINEMNKTDLWSHASKLGLVPIDNTSLLKRTLLSEFRKHVNGYKRPPEKKAVEQNISREVLKILAEGR